MESGPSNKVRFKRIGKDRHIKNRDNNYGNFIKNTLSLVPQSFNEGCCQRAPDLTIRNTLLEGTADLSHLRNAYNKPNSTKDYCRKEERSLRSTEELSSLADQPDSCKLVFKYHHETSSWRTYAPKKKLRFIHMHVETKVNKENGSVNLEYGRRISSKPAFRIKKPPSLEQGNLKQGQFMGLLNLNI